MFIQNKYHIWYYLIVEAARSRDTIGYTEKHHVLPKCFGGGNGNNLVRLTAREHFICHRLLVHMTSGRDKSKMSFALQHFLRNNPQHDRIPVTNARTYESIRRHISAASSDINKGKMLSQATRDKISKANTGKRRTDEHKSNTSKASKLMWENNHDKMVTAHQTPEIRRKISEGNKGKTLSKKLCAEISIRNSGTGNGRARTIKVTSPVGEVTICHGSFQKFCKSNGLPFSSMCHLLHRTRSFDVGKTVGWSVEFAV